MTLREVMDVLWHRKAIIIGVVAVAVLVAWWYVDRSEPVFTSQASARTSVVVSDAMLGGLLAGVPVDFEISSIESAQVLEAAATRAGEPGVDLSAAVEHDLEVGARTHRIYVSATAPSPEAAQARAAAVIVEYSTYLQDQIDATVETLTTRRDEALENAQELQVTVARNEDDAIAAAELAEALGTFAGLGEQITTIQQSGAPIAILTPAQPGERVGASDSTILAVAVLTALIAGIGLALLRDQFDQRLRGEHEVERLTQLPSLGELSHNGGLLRRTEPLPVMAARATALGEGLRSIRSSLQVLLPAKHSVLVVTSVEPGDGKTFVSANLALAWARAGLNVIVVGGDLRRPSLDTYFGAAALGPGLTELLQDALAADVPLTRARVEKRLNATEHRGLRVLPSGTVPVDPADLLAHSTLQQVMTMLRGLADVVVIDSPPALRLVDANLLSAHADGIVVLAWQQRTLRGFLTETVDTLRLNDAPVVGVIVNGVRRRTPRSYASYYVHGSGARQWFRRRREDDDLDPSAQQPSRMPHA